MSVSTAPDERIEARLAAWREGACAEALGELLRWQRDRACAVASGILGSASDAEDAVQQAFVKLLSRRRGFEDRSAFTAAVTRAVVQCSIDHLRARRSRDRHQEAYARMHRDETGPADQVVAREQAAAVRAALAELPDEERLAVVLCCQDGHSVAAGARLLEVPRGTLRHRLRRGRQRLRGILAGRGFRLGSAGLAAGLATSAHAAGPTLCARLDEVLPGAGCEAVPAAPAAVGFGPGVTVVAAGVGPALVGGGLAAIAVAGIALASTRDQTSPKGSIARVERAAAAAIPEPESVRSDPMKLSHTITTTALAIAASNAAVSAEERIPVADLPEAVVAAVTAADGATIVEAEREDEDGVEAYEVEVRIGEREVEYLVTATGEVLAVEEEIALAELPADVLAQVEAAAPGASFEEVERERVGEAVSYSLEGLDADGREIEVEIAADGTIEVEREDDEGEDDEEESEAEVEDF